MKEAIELLQKEVNVINSVLSDKEWGKHDDGELTEFKTFRSRVIARRGQLYKAIRVLKNHKPEKNEK